jgi:phenylalanyl-tRNA synthetase alpha chain
MTEPVQLVDSLERIEGEGLASIEAAGSLEELEALRVRYLGRSGDLAGMLSRIGQAPAEDRRAIGQAANTAKRRLQEAHASRQTALERAESVGVAQADLTMPGRRAWEGGVHPVTRVIDEILEIFRELGFSKVRGPEAETEWLVQLPGPQHPARASGGRHVGHLLPG